MTELGPSPVEAGQKAANLKEQLKAFAAIEDEVIRGQKLAEVVDFVANQADKDTMDNLVPPESPFQEILSRAVDKALSTPIKINNNPDTEPVDGWKGHGTAVVLLSDGEIGGTFNRPTGLEDPLPDDKGNYGDLRRYALIKAMCSLHLDKSGKKGGILGNYDYLSGIGLKPYETLFTGAADEPIELWGKKVFVAGSGLEAKEEFIGEYLKDALGLESVTVKRETQAGLFDSLASNRIARNLVKPELANEPIVIPSKEMARDN